MIKKEVEHKNNINKLNKLMECKKNLKKRMPNFIRQEYNKRKRLPSNWRRPRGIHSKIRLQTRGKPAKVKIGYKSPVAIRYILPIGFRKRVIKNIDDLKGINKKEIPVLSRVIGSRKKIKILQEAKRLRISFLNLKDIDAAINNINNQLIKNKKLRKERADRKAAREKKSKKKLAKAQESKKTKKAEEKQKSEPIKEEKKEPKKTEKKASDKDKKAKKPAKKKETAKK